MNNMDPLPESLTKYWRKLKQTNYEEFREKLFMRTNQMLHLITEVHQLNVFGIYHNTRNKAYWEEMRSDYEQKQMDHWIGKGNFYGVWCALFSPESTYTFTINPLQYIVQFHLKEGYKLYNPHNLVDNIQWEEFLTKRLKDNNRWETIINTDGISLAERLKQEQLPFHHQFFQENRIAGVIGISDYLAFVLMNPDAIEKIDFLEYPS